MAMKTKGLYKTSNIGISRWKLEKLENWIDSALKTKVAIRVVRSLLKLAEGPTNKQMTKLVIKPV